MYRRNSGKQNIPSSQKVPEKEESQLHDQVPPDSCATPPLWQYGLTSNKQLKFMVG